MALDSRKPKASQGLLEDMLDPDVVARLNDEASDETFPIVETIKPEFTCPRCSYGWRGNPNPPTGEGVTDE